MITPELIAIGLILIFQPLIAFLWAFLIFRITYGYAVNRAETAVDGRIDRIDEKLRGNQ